MTELQTTQPVPENEPRSTTPDAGKPEAEGEAPAPPPEPPPWTPERVLEWNAYYDKYVVLAVLLLALIVACNYVTDSHFFVHLKTGQLIGEQMAPPRVDDFSYTETGQPWVDLNWLFQWSHAALYGLFYNLVPVNPEDLTASRPQADMFSVRALGFIDALVHLLAAWALLRIRHRGPGTWWAAICAMLAVGIFWDPEIGLAPGGLAAVPASGAPMAGISPGSWGMLFLALELLIVFRAFDQGRAGYLWGLIPLFALWANWDTSFLTGLILLAAIVLGHWLDGGLLSWPESEAPAPVDDAGKGESPAVTSGPRPVPLTTALMILGLCVAACLLNPWTYRAYVEAFGPFTRLIRPMKGYNIISFFGEKTETATRAFYFIMLALGVASFVVNSARFSWRRFLAFAAAALLWGCLIRYSVEFALVFAMVIALNGQEAYLARFGAEGRLGAGWTLWSTGGRLVTLALIFTAVGLDITGYHIAKPLVHFGLGYNPDFFPMEAAEFLERHDELKGKVLNTSVQEGDMIIWKAYPKRRTFIDGRRAAFPDARFEEWDRIRRAIRDDDAATWKPLLDQYKITAVMLEPRVSDKTYDQLKKGLYWIPFYDDGRVVIYGRKDAPASDLAFFTANRLDPDRVYRLADPVPPVSGPPTPVSWIDEVFPNRSLERSQMRTQAALRWLRGGTGMPEPARCLLAIQNARIALSRNPDDWGAFRVLNEAYQLLTLQEAALLAGIPLTPENMPRIGTISPSPQRQQNRFRQRIAVLNYAIQTTPPPETIGERDELFALNMQLYELYIGLNFGDLARDRLKAALALNPSKEQLPPEVREGLQRQLEQLDQLIQQIAARLDEVDIEQQPKPEQLAQLAQQQGAIGMAIEKLARADESGDSPMLIKPQLLDLYCATGQPDKALDLLNVGAIGDPNLGTEPGYATFRQGLVYLLLGNYRSAATLYERSILQVRMDRSNRAMMAAKAMARGEQMFATDQFLAIPSSIQQQASWEFDAGMCLLEGGEIFQAGEQAGAAEHLIRALTLEPDLPMRPIAAYYLEKLGKPVPPRRDAAAAEKTSGGEATVKGAAPAATPGHGVASPLPGPAAPGGAAAPAEPKAKAAPTAEPAKSPQPAKSPEPAKSGGANSAVKKVEAGKSGR